MHTCIYVHAHALRYRYVRVYTRVDGALTAVASGLRAAHFYHIIWLKSKLTTTVLRGKIQVFSPSEHTSDAPYLRVARDSQAQGQRGYRALVSPQEIPLVSAIKEQVLESIPRSDSFPL